LLEWGNGTNSLLVGEMEVGDMGVGDMGLCKMALNRTNIQMHETVHGSVYNSN